MNVPTLMRYTQNVLKYWRIESLCIKATLNYQKIENIMYQKTFMNAVRETLK